MLNQRVMVTAVIKKKNKYLLLKRGKKTTLWRGKWQFPEGGIKFGESPLDSLKRELKEETGLKLKNAKFLKFHSSTIRYFGKSLYHALRLMFICKVSGNIKLSNAHDDYKWFTKRQIRKLRLVNGFEFC
jgi:8-oxo-dGTP diphosphatase